MHPHRHPVIEGKGVRLLPTTAADLATARTLFRHPDIYETWGGAPISDEDLEAKYLGLRSPAVESFIVEVAGSVVGFAQYYVAEDDRGGGGMDLVLLGESRGKGVGTAVVEAMVRYVGDVLGWRRFVVDPDESNERGTSFWKKAGFVPERRVDDEPGRDPYWLMSWRFET